MSTSQLDLNEVPAMKTRPKYIFFSDFDGTITLDDSNDYITDNLGYGKEKRVAGNKAVLNGTLPFRQLFTEMMQSIHEPYSRCISELEANVRLDPGFKTFFEWAYANNIPIVVLSGGMKPIIRALLKKLVGEEYDKMEIISSDVRAKPGRQLDEADGWEIVFHDPSDHGHDKSIELRKYSSLPADVRPVMFYAGDGVSDLSAAKETELLFAKRGKDLVSYCVKQGQPFTEFDDWSLIHQTVKDIVEGRKTVDDAAKEGFAKYETEKANRMSGDLP